MNDNDVQYVPIDEALQGWILDRVITGEAQTFKKLTDRYLLQASKQMDVYLFPPEVEQELVRQMSEAMKALMFDRVFLLERDESLDPSDFRIMLTEKGLDKVGRLFDTQRKRDNFRKLYTQMWTEYALNRDSEKLNRLVEDQIKLFKQNKKREKVASRKGKKHGKKD